MKKCYEVLLKIPENSQKKFLVDSVLSKMNVVRFKLD